MVEGSGQRGGLFGGLGSVDYKSFNHIDDFCSFAREHAESLDHWSTSISGRVGELYAEGRLGVAFKFSSRDIESEGIYLSISAHTMIANCESDATISIHDSKSLDLHHGDTRDKHNVFVVVVQEVQPSQRAVSIRLHTRNEFDHIARCSLEFTRYAAIEVGFLFVNGEAGVPVWRSALTADEITGKVIESRSKVVRGVSYDSCKVVGDRLVESAKDVVGTLSVRLDRDSVWVVVDELAQRYFKFSDVMLCPSDLELWAKEKAFCHDKGSNEKSG